MAENKKSFVAYADWNSTFEKLSDDEAGKLAKMLFAFVNDKQPEAPDRLTELLFDPLKNQLKRDLKSYEKTIEEKSRKGRIGNLKRWHPEIYKKVLNEELPLDEAENIIAEHRYSDNSDKKTTVATNLSLNIADTVDVNDTVTDILLEKETKEKKIRSGFPAFEADKTSNSDKEKSCAKKEIFNFRKAMTDYGFATDLTDEWLQIRKRKSAVNSELAFKNFISQVEKAGKPPNDILKLVTQKQWKGFENQWLDNLQNGKPTTNTARAGSGKISGTAALLDGAEYFEFA